MQLDLANFLAPASSTGHGLLFLIVAGNVNATPIAVSAAARGGCVRLNH